MPNIKVITISRDINVGVTTVIEFLNKKGVEDVTGPNSRISSELSVECVKELGKSLSGEEKKALISKYTAPKGGKKASESKKEEAPKVEEEHQSEPKESPKKETETPKKEKDVVKVEIPEELKPGIVTKGTIDLDNLSKGAKPILKKEKEEKEEEKPSEPAKVVSKNKAKKEDNKKETKTEKKVETSKKDDKEEKATKEATAKELQKDKESNNKKDKVVAETAQKQKEDKKAEKVEKAKKDKKEDAKTESDAKKAPTNKEESLKEPKAKTEEKKSEKKPKKEEDKEEHNVVSHLDQHEDEKVFRPTDPQKGPGVKIVGKIDLSEVDPQPSSRRKKRREAGQRKKRKRINKQKVDISAKENMPKDNNQQRGGRRGQNESRKRADNQPKGRKAKRAAAKKEVTQEEIQKQIKETLMQMQNQKRKGASAAKYRRDKREAHRREIAEEERATQESKKVRLTEYVTANDLATMIDVPVNDIITLCFNIGIIVSINQRLEKDTIDLILDEYGYEPEYVSAEVVEAIQEDEEEDSEEDLEPRAPIVTVMGHVDHGKTSLLDNIRKTNVIAGEAGGITQHVGAYSVSLKDGRRITFLDTPGHEAFTAMRARGAQVTDIAIIVVAADDGVMPQTIEAINHASMAGVPIIFAINKIDKPQSNPDKIKEELANLNYLVEDWGGKYQSQNISAKKNIGVDELLEKVLLEAEMLDLKANPNKRAVGSVIESTLEHGRGYTTKVLIQEGTLRIGDFILSGTCFGRVKALFNERGKNVEEVGPAMPVKVLGLNGAAQAGDAFNVLESEQEARDIASKREQLQREQRERMHRIPTLQSLGERIKQGNVQELNIIVKGDVDGSVEALSGSIEKLSTDEVKVRVIHKAVGQISDSDVVLAAASDGVIIGFQVRPSATAKKLAENEGVEIRLYSVIYTALDEVKAAMEGMLEPEIEEKVVANLEVRETFHISKVGTIAGCIVKEGKISRNSNVRLIRDGIVIFTGHLASLKRFKDDVKEVTNGYECGLNLDGFNDVKVGDQIEAYEEVEIKKTL